MKTILPPLCVLTALAAIGIGLGNLMWTRSHKPTTATVTGDWTGWGSREASGKAQGTYTETWIPITEMSCDATTTAILESGSTGQYKCDPTTKKWTEVVRDPKEIMESLRWQANRAQRKKKLAFALVSRVLTEKELREVMDLGPELYADTWESSSKTERMKFFDNGLLQQFELREMRRQAKAGAVEE